MWAKKCKIKIKYHDPRLPVLPKFEGKITQMQVMTKSCPNCGTQWEKNGGCNHIQLTIHTTYHYILKINV